MCVCRGCYLLFTDRAGRAALPRRARPLPLVPGLRARTAATGTPCRSRSGWRSSSATRRWTATVAFYPGPAGATESELALDAWERHRGRQTRGSARSPHDIEALLVRVPDRGASRLQLRICRADRRLLRVRRPPADAVARLRRRHRGARLHRRLLRDRRGPEPSGATVHHRPGRRDGHPRRSPSSTCCAGAVRRRAAADRPAAHRGVQRGRRSTRSRCAARSASSRSAAATTRRTRAACSTCSGDRERWRDTLKHLPVACSAPRWCRDSPAAPRWTCRCRAPTTSR